MMKRLLFGIFSLCLCACHHDEKPRQDNPAYFELTSYFKSEAARLAKAGPLVNKTVVINGKEEQKKLAIKDWEKEFDAFFGADINKASWRGMFQADSTNGVKTYTTQSEKIPVKKLVVRTDNGKVMSIEILINNTNDLYASQDTLSYFPDSLYHIIKSQKIKLMTAKRFEVVGRLEQLQ